jgi:pimeloyl-ACP methyl ester carboxylesterase
MQQNIGETMHLEHFPENSKTSRAEVNNIILIHGLAASSHDWDALSSELLKSSLTPYILDLLGHGNGPKPLEIGAFTADGSYIFFETWINNLGDLFPTILIGHSFGGYLSIKYALGNPNKVKALILVDPLLSFQQLSWFHRMMFNIPYLASFVLKIIPLSIIKILVNMGCLSLKDRKLVYSLSPNIRAQTALDYKRCSPKIAHIPRSLKNTHIDYDRLGIPILLIWGREDRTLATRWFKEWANKKPNIFVMEFSTGHVPHQSCPEKFNNITLEFIKNLQANGSE